jgi:hypothetical protein
VPLVIGSQYAELLDLCRAAQWDEAYPPTGSFRAKKVRDRSYWYFQPSTVDGRRAAETDLLTPNQGSDDDTLLAPPALGTDAVALRFLDFLIHDPVDAVVLHDDGIPVVVPAPERYAVHKLIISGRRHQASAKAPKDVVQAGELILALHETSRWTTMRRAFEEACTRGPTWRNLPLDGLANATDHVERRASDKLRMRLADLAQWAAAR